MVISNLNSTDIPRFLALAEALHNLHSPYPFSKNFKASYINQILNNEDYFLKGYKENGELIGYLLARKEYDEINRYFFCHIIEVIIDESYRNQGLAKSLLTECLEWARIHNVKEVSANVLLNNIPSEKTFIGQSFKPVSQKFIKYLDK